MSTPEAASVGTPRRCEKCGETADLLIRYREVGSEYNHRDSHRRDLPPGYYKPRYPDDPFTKDEYLKAARPHLRVHCRVCQWWWVEEPGAALQSPSPMDAERERLAKMCENRATWCAVIANGSDARDFVAIAEILRGAPADGGWRT